MDKIEKLFTFVETYSAVIYSDVYRIWSHIYTHDYPWFIQTQGYVKVILIPAVNFILSGPSPRT